MTTAVELLRQGRNDELWNKCCGYLDLDIEQFMTIQKRLMMEQLQLLKRCALGERIMGGARPATIEEFRQSVPLTTYSDYCPELLQKNESVLPAKPAFWIRTSGKSGAYSCKWSPMTAAFSNEMSAIMYGLGILSASNGEDKPVPPELPRIVYAVAPRPYTSGAMAAMLQEQTPVDYLPSLETAENTEFEERVKLGFKDALSHGMDYFFGLSLVLVAVGNQFQQMSNKTPIRPLLSRPKALFRLGRGLVRSKLAHRPMLPKDLWSVKGIICSGLDSAVYREKIKTQWGRYPLDIYSGTEGGIIATQAWDYGSMTFIPNLNFLEFIPEEEHFKARRDPGYRPLTLLLDEVKAGECYEVVITNFHGGAMVRYRPGDMVRITSLRNEKLGINIPQMAFHGRADDLLDFGVTRLTERTIWQAIENTGIPYEDWVARKEVDGGMKLHLSIELKDNSTSAAAVKTAVDAQLRRLDASFAATHSDVGGYLNFSLEVSLLPRGAFSNYISRRRAEGSELAHLKPPHVNPSDAVLSQLEGNRPVTSQEAIAKPRPEKIAV
jgi:hypothetical protein